MPDDPNDVESYLDPVPLNRVVRGGDKLQGVQPELLSHWNNLQGEFTKAGLTPEIKSGFRTAAQQNALFRNPATSARTKGNDGYVNISPHQRGDALDISFPATQRAKGRQIIANYAQQNSLHVPLDEPWHIAIPRQGKAGVESYLDPQQPTQSTPATRPVSGIEGYLDPQKPTIGTGRGAAMARVQGTTYPVRRRAQQQQGWGGGGTIGQGVPNISVNAMGGPQPSTGVGGLRQIDDPETSRIIRAQQQVTAEQTPFEKHLGLGPGSEESKTLALRRTENEAVLERVAAEKAQEDQSVKQIAWEQENKAEIDRHVADYRKQIQDSGMTKWLTELQGKGAAELMQFGAGAAKTVGAPNAANAMRIRAVAAAQAAQEESKDRTEASKTVQDILGGFAGSAPELLLMQVGIPPVATFAAGSGLRASGMSKPVVPAITQGALTGAAFEIPEAGAPGVRGTLTRSGKVGAATAGVDLATGAPVGQALKSGVVNAAMIAGPGLANEPSARAAERTREAAVRPVMDAQGNTLLNPDEVAAGGKSRVRLAQGGNNEAQINRTTDKEVASVGSGAPGNAEGMQEPTANQPNVPRTGSEQGGVGPTIRAAPETVASATDVSEPVRHVDLQKRTEDGKFDEETPAQAEARRQQVTQSVSTPQPEPATQAYPATPDAASSLPVNQSTGAAGVASMPVGADTATEINKALNFAGDRHFVAKFLEGSPLKAKVLAAIPRGSVLAGPDPRMPERQGGPIRLRAPDGTIWEVDTGDAHKGDPDWKPIGHYTDGFAVRKTGEGVVEPVNTSAASATSMPEVAKGVVNEPKLQSVSKEELPLSSNQSQAAILGASDTSSAEELRATDLPSSSRVAAPPVPEGKPPAASQPEVSRETSQTTSIKHAVVEAERELQGLPQFTKARRSHGQSFDEGVAAVRSGDIDPRALASTLVKDPRPLSTKESMALLYDRMRISNAKEQAAGELQSAMKSGNAEQINNATEKVKQLDDASNANDEAVYRAGSEQGRGLAIRRELINRDYSRAVVTAKLQAMNRGKALPEDVQAKVDDLTSRLEQANKRIDELEAGKGGKQSAAQTDKFVREYKLKLRQQGRARTREVLAAERVDLKQRFAAEFRAQKPKSSTLSMGGLGDLDPEGKLSKIAVELARNYIEDGVIKATDVVDAVHNHLKDVADLSKREVSDLISGYGRTKQSVTDPIEKKLGEVRSILASTSGKADVLEKGIRPLRRGQQREKPTEDQRRALRDLQDAMREQGPRLAKQSYDVETQQATPLDKAKTTTRNRIEQLKQWITDGKREVQGRQQVIPDNELTRLKGERAALERVASLISDPAADQKAVERRLTELNKSMAESRAVIQSGKVSPEVREGAKSLWSPEIGAAEKERAVLRQIVTDMRTDAARKTREAPQPKAPFYGATGSWAEYEAEARKTLNAQKAQSQRWRQKVSDLQTELAGMQKDQQRTVKAERKITPETDEVRVAKRNAQVLQSQIDQLGNVIDWRNKNIGQKALAYTAAGVRAGVLTGTRTIGKIGSALGQSAIQQYGGEIAGEGARKLFPRTSALAPRHGQRIGLESERAFIGGVKQGVKDIPRALKSGETSLTLESGKRYLRIPTKAGTILSVPGRVHMAEKSILGSGENARAETMNLQWAKKQGMDIDSADVRQWAKNAAHKHAEEIMMLGDNPFSRFIQWGRRSMSKEGQDVSRIAVPVERVPSNYLFGQLIGEYGLGLPRGLARGAASEIRLRSALRKAVKDTTTHYMDGTLVEAAKELERRNPDLMGRLTPEAADKTMRLLKRGSVGLVYMALGAAGGGKLAFGGYFGGAGDKNEVKPGDVKIGPVTIPHWALHSPPNELAQFTFTMKREIQSQVAKNKGQGFGQRLRTGLATGIKGTAQQVPFLNEYVDAVSSLKNGESMSTAMGKWLASRVEPQIMQELARATDKEETETARRKPKGFTEAMKMGVPGLRQTIPVDKSRDKALAKQSLVDRLRAGQDIDLDSAVDEGKITKADRRVIEKQGAMTPFQSAFNNAHPDKALDRYERMSATQRASVDDLMSAKAYSLLHSDALTDAQKEKFQQRIDKLGIEPRNPQRRQSSSPFTRRLMMGAHP